MAGAWIGSAVYALGVPGGPLKYWSPALVATSMIAFVVIHGRRFEGARGLMLLVATVFLVGWMFESVSIVTGFPFGNYHYTDIMAPFVGHVPVSVMPAYLVMGYTSWAMAQTLLLGRDRADNGTGRFSLPFVAACLMVLWDLSMDPLRATIEQRWIWHDGGSHLGVPLMNYVGWFFVTWVMFQTYALIRPERPRPACDTDELRLFQLSAPLMYLAFPVEYVLNPAVADPEYAAVFIESAQRSTGYIYAATALLTLATMVPVAALAVYRAARVEAAPPYPVADEETLQ